MKPVPENAEHMEEAPSSLLFPTFILIGASIYFGIDTDLPLGAAIETAKQLTGNGE